MAERRIRPKRPPAPSKTQQMVDAQIAELKARAVREPETSVDEGSGYDDAV